MNSLERCLATIRLQPHDRVPVDLHNFMMTLAGVNLPPDKKFRDGQLLGEAQIAAWQRFGHDMLIVENGTGALAEACGCEVSYTADSAPVIKKPLLHDLSEVASLKRPDPTRSPLCKAVLDATRLILDRIGDRVFVMGRADQGPLSLASMIAGPEMLLVEMAAGERDDEIFALARVRHRSYILLRANVQGNGMPRDFGGRSPGFARCDFARHVPEVLPALCPEDRARACRATTSSSPTIFAATRRASLTPWWIREPRSWSSITNATRRGQESRMGKDDPARSHRSQRSSTPRQR